MVGLALFGAMIFYLELEVVLTLPVKTINATPTPGYLYANLYASLYAGVFLYVGILLGEECWGGILYWENTGARWERYGHPLPAMRKPQPCPR
jgi:hypothetical protein